MLIRLDAARYEPFFWQESIELKEEEIRELELLGTSAVRCAGSLTHAEPDYLLHADLTYHLFVMMAHRGVTLVELEAELGRRFGLSGLDEKASRPPKPE